MGKGLGEGGTKSDGRTAELALKVGGETGCLKRIFLNVLAGSIEISGSFTCA